MAWAGDMGLVSPNLHKVELPTQGARSSDSDYPTPVRQISAVLALGLLLFGCATNVGPDGLAVGGPCVDAFDCVSGSYCLRTLATPDGTCTTVCGGDADCRAGSRCIELSEGACLLACESDEDCVRPGYACRERARRGESGTAPVCVGN